MGVQATVNLAIGLIFLIETTIGVLGNFSFLCHYIILSFTEYRRTSTDFIHKHLIVANVLALLCKGVPQTMAAFGRKYFLSDLGCKLLFFLHRVGRGVSIGSICALSVYQAVTISPGNSRWAELKVKAPKYIFPSIFLCWVLQMLVNVIFPIYLTSTSSDENITDKRKFGYCSAVRHEKIQHSLHGVLLSFPDVLCLGLMLWSSSSMVFLLYRHKQRVQHIRRTTASSRSSPEARATKTILLLVSTFNITDRKEFGYCSAVRHDKTRDLLYAVLLAFPDMLCLGLMLWASSSMVLLLYRHKQRVQHIRRISTSSRSSPEARATKTILLLMSTFGYFYTLSSIFQLVVGLFDNPSLILINTAAIMSLSFPTVSSLLLMSHNSKVTKIPKLFCAWRRKIKSPCLMKTMQTVCISTMYTCQLFIHLPHSPDTTYVSQEKGKQEN
uniref:G-protein coupled receptors family 1 profile domain-containing protein n=1 Tax=Suricata suricatta TaxID=37032 RepID=A0A673UAW7_SURSU